MIINKNSKRQISLIRHALFIIDYPQSYYYKFPAGVNDIPVQLKINKELLEQKNMYADYKRVEPPRQLMASIVEMQQNERPTLETRKHPRLDAQRPKRRAVFETLHQERNPDLEEMIARNTNEDSNSPCGGKDTN